MPLFDISQGRIVGRDHIGGNNKLIGDPVQDAVRVYQRDKLTIGIVCDGCGSRKKSHVGSQIGVDSIPELVAESLDENGKLDWSDITERIKSTLWSQACALARSNDAHKVATVLDEYFLFTIVIIVITEETTEIATFGDAVFALNGSVVSVEPFANNFPAYIAYLLLDTEWSTSQLHFVVQKSVPTSSVESALIGSDGVNYLIKAERRFIPGTKIKIGPLSQVWSRDDLFPNEDDDEPLTTWLRTLNAEVCQLGPDEGFGVDLDRQAGALKDDVGIISIRRAKVVEPLKLVTTMALTVVSTRLPGVPQENGVASC